MGIPINQAVFPWNVTLRSTVLLPLKKGGLWIGAECWWGAE